MESTARPGIHVLGDSTLSAALMPKSGHMANQHAKVAAAAIIELMNGRQPSQAPMMANTCYSFVDDKQVVHVASVHAYDAKDRTMKVVPGSGGLSAGPTELEGAYGNAWARNIWSDMLG
jgi:sulfide dehydrogenase [flavocytochrome c] flavoprotein subunit